MLTKPSVFISYARDEGEKFAKNLRKRLQKALPQIEFWRGRSSMQGGLPWWAQTRRRHQPCPLPYPDDDTSSHGVSKCG